MLGNVRNQKESDCALMLSFASGDLKGFELLYRRHRQSVYRFFYFGTHGDESLTAELFHDVWTTVVRGRVRYTDDITFTDWLYHAAWARLHDHLRLYPLEGKIQGEQRESTVVSIDAYLGLEQPLPQQTTEADDGEVTSNDDSTASTALLQCISQMNPEHKEVVLLRFCFSMSKQEIADFLDVNKSLVEKLVHQAVKLLRSDIALSGTGG